MPTWFNSRKAAQVAAFYCEKEGGKIPVLKLIKLIYLADRESMQKSCYPITNDRFVSMPHGPANSMTLNYVDGNVTSKEWRELISDKDNWSVGLTRNLTDDDCDELSDFEVAVLESVWSQYGHLDKWAIRDWTHDNCPEWEDPEGSSNPIPYSRVLKFLGVKDADAIEAEIVAQRHVDAVFDKLKA